MPPVLVPVEMFPVHIMRSPGIVYKEAMLSETYKRLPLLQWSDRGYRRSYSIGVRTTLALDTSTLIITVKRSMVSHSDTRLDLSAT